MFKNPQEKPTLKLKQTPYSNENSLLYDLIPVWVTDFYWDKKRRQLLCSVSLCEPIGTKLELSFGGFKAVKPTGRDGLNFFIHFVRLIQHFPIVP